MSQYIAYFSLIVQLRLIARSESLVTKLHLQDSSLRYVRHTCHFQAQRALTYAGSENRERLIKDTKTKRKIAVGIQLRTFCCVATKSQSSVMTVSGLSLPRDCAKIKGLERSRKNRDIANVGLGSPNQYHRILPAMVELMCEVTWLCTC